MERKIGATETCEKGSSIRSHRPTSMDIILTILPIVIFRRPSAFSLSKFLHGIWSDGLSIARLTL